ncbi:MAG: hypothetical protein VX089_03885 [Pseudomonadota bacterium]|nr:hypothetical protein [Pseudomonadota bacterium]
MLIFLTFLIFILNPQINKKHAEFHKDIVIVVTDMTQSIIETRKDKEVETIHKDLSSQLYKLGNIEQINIKLNNNKIIEYNEKEKETSLFKEVNNVINNLNIERLSGIIVITDGQIHDLHNYNKLLSKTPIHYILVGNKKEKDRILKTTNVPKYAILGKKYELSVEIIDNIEKKDLKTEFFLNEKLVDTKYLSPNNNFKIPLPKLSIGKNILEIRTEEANKEISKLNNYQIHEIDGIQNKLKVMLISGEPNMGLRNLRNILNSDPNIELLHFTILRPPTKRDLTPVKELSLIPFPTQELFAADISKFNLIIFDQYGLQGILPPKYLENISNFVFSGGALLDIVGKKHLTRDSLINSPIKEILPTKPLESISNKSFRPKLTDVGKRHPITNKLKNNYGEKPWGKWTNYTRSQLTSGKVLLHHENDPLLAVDNVGKGRVVQILSSDSWIWQKSLDNKGPLIELTRNIIQWLLKNPKLEENFVNFYKDNNLIKIKLNSVSSGDINTKIVTPNKKSVNLKLKDTGNGIFEGEFKSLERGKFQMIWKDKIKYFILDDINNKEVEEIISTDNKIKSYIEENIIFTKNFNVVWNDGDTPKIIRIYNNKILSGKNWIGVLEKNAPKISEISKQKLFNWYTIFMFLVFLIFFCWYKEGRN